MARFIQSKDLAFFEKISKELVEDVVSTAIQFFKLSIAESRTNLYGESLNKSYHQGVTLNWILEWEDTVTNYAGFGADTGHNV